MSKLVELTNRVEHSVVELAECLKQRGWFAGTAESCTGGWIAQMLTAAAGSSSWFESGIVTYSNAAKINLLGVDPMTIERHGAVSGETAEQMVTGLIKNTGVEVGVAVTGIAGPSGGTSDKPVGLVWFGFAISGRSTYCTPRVFSGNRQAVRLQAVDYALLEMIRLLA
jgi:nicotinamide-nucleotide amidase